MHKIGSTFEGYAVVLGVGVTPRTDLAERAGLSVDNGIIVTETLLTSAPGIYAAGDVACYPDPATGENVRIEHWVVAERIDVDPKQVAGRSRFDSTPEIAGLCY